MSFIVGQSVRLTKPVCSVNAAYPVGLVGELLVAGANVCVCHFPNPVGECIKVLRDEIEPAGPAD